MKHLFVSQMAPLSRQYLRLRLGIIVILALAVGAAAPIASAQATFKLLHSFQGPPSDGTQPSAGLYRSGSGRLFGTTVSGGQFFNLGAAFSLTTTGTESLLHSFAGGSDGDDPYAGLIADSVGNLYGASSGVQEGMCGNVFKIDAALTLTVLHQFLGGTTDGCGAFGGLVRDSAGNFYGATAAGGAFGAGTVYKIDATNSFSILYSFGATAIDATNPNGGLVRDSGGNLFGSSTTTGNNQASCGNVFKIDATGKETIVHRFGAKDGCLPQSLALDATGKLYGAAQSGPGSSRDTIFTIGPTGVLSGLHVFVGATEGKRPNGSLVRDAAGVIYGTTQQGGVLGRGTAYKIDIHGAVTVLHNFAGGAKDGDTPMSGVLRDSAGNLYGTTYLGGPADGGTVYELTQ